MQNIKILVVDDDKEIRNLIKRYLEVEGYFVDEAEDGIKALQKFNKSSYDLIIADIMMPRMDGIDFVKKVREKSNILVIFLTAKESEIDRVLGFKIGADDYITKPFYMNELVVRVKSHLKRYKILSNGELKDYKLKFDGIEIDKKRVKVIKDGQEINLRAKEFELLVFLAENNGQVFSKGQIFEHVWKDDFMTDDNTVMVHIRRIRQKIEDDPNEPKYIQTVWGLGYKFEGKRGN